MSWNVTKTDTKAKLLQAITEERERGHMSGSHYGVLCAVVGEAPEGRPAYALSSNGSQNADGQSLSITLKAEAAVPAVGGADGTDHPTY